MGNQVEKSGLFVGDFLPNNDNNKNNNNNNNKKLYYPLPDLNGQKQQQIISLTNN